MEGGGNQTKCLFGIKFGSLTSTFKSLKSLLEIKMVCLVN